MSDKPREFWVPEDFIYESASECLLAHPEQAAQLMRDDSVKLKADKLAEALEHRGPCQCGKQQRALADYRGEG